MDTRTRITTLGSEKVPSSTKQPSQDYGQPRDPYEIVEDDVLDLLRQREARRAQQENKIK